MGQNLNTGIIFVIGSTLVIIYFVKTVWKSSANELNKKQKSSLNEPEKKIETRPTYQELQRRKETEKLKNKSENISQNFNNPANGVWNFEDIPDRPLPPTTLQPFIQENEIFEERDDLVEVENLTVYEHFFIEYIDANGSVSRRKITVYKISHIKSDPTNYYLESYCHEKKAQRKFKVSRIKSMIDIETGEILNIKHTIDDLVHNTRLITKCFAELQSELLIFIFMGRVDGRLTGKECDLIIQYFVDIYPENLDTELLYNAIKRTHCSQKEFRNSIKKLQSKDEAYKNNLFNYILLIAKTDKKINPMETAIIEIIKKEFNIAV